MYTVMAMKLKPRRCPYHFLVGASLILAFSSCASVGRAALPATADEADGLKKPDWLEFVFAGDIMAHESNYLMGDYADIYRDVHPILASDSLSFGNLEMPVADSLPLSTYPRFNVHGGYVDAAIAGGFDVFSLANNHSNDQGSRGIGETLARMKASEGKVASSGLRSAAGEPMRPVLIEKNGWRILFLAVTEILNSYDTSKSLVYLIGTGKAERAKFCDELSRMRKEYPCDVFVLSIHLSEEEYVRNVSRRKREWFRAIAAAGVDIVWGHHPHVMQTWETYRGPEREDDAFFMYSMGNFISGQRASPEYENPDGYREYTGDAVLLRVRVSREPSPDGSRFSAEAIPVTNHVDPARGIVVRRFDGAFLDSLGARRRAYYVTRYSLMKSYLPLLPLEPDPTILE